MAHKWLAYVVLASSISLRVIAVPTAQASENPEPPAMCADRTISWEEKWDICSRCDIPDLPRSIWVKYCAEDGPGAHEKAQGIQRRDAALTAGPKDDQDELGYKGPPRGRARVHEIADRLYKPDIILARSQESEDAAGSVLHKDDTEHAEFHILPYRRDPDAVVSVRPSLKPFPILRPLPIPKPGPVLERDSTAHPKATSESTLPTTTTDDMRMKSKRDSMQTFNNVETVTTDETNVTDSEDSEDRPADEVVTPPERKVHQVAPGVWKKRGLVPLGAVAHGQATELVGDGYPPVNEKKREASPVRSLEGQSETSHFRDAVVHKEASEVWRKRDPMGFRAVVLPQAPALHTNDNIVRKKRESSPVRSLAGQTKGNSPGVVGIHDGIRRRERDILASGSLLLRQSSGQESSSSEATQTTSETQAPETPAGTTQEDTEPTAPDSIQPTATYKPFIPGPRHFTPAIVHAAANDVHRREERVRAREWVWVG